MSMVHVSLAFAGLPDTDLDDFTQNVITKFGSGPLAAGSPVTVADLTTANGKFHTAIAATINGGQADTAAKDNARDVVEDMLRQIALYVQGKNNGDTTVVLNAGFSPASTNRAQSQLDTPTIIAITNEMSGQLVVRASSVDNAKAYQARLTVGTNPPIDGGVFTQARRIVLTNLTPGTTYAVEIRAVGGSTGYSDWSDPVSHMAM
jgi:hypothetical protein